MDGTIRDSYCFTGSRSEDSAHYYDTVIMHGYDGDMDFLAWDSAHKFGTRMTSVRLASFYSGIVIGEKALEAAEFLDNERDEAFKSCDEFGRKKKMQEKMGVIYSNVKTIFGVEIKIL